MSSQAGNLASSSAAADATEVASSRVVSFLAVSVQLILVALAIRLFKIEDGFGFQKILWLIVGGFMVHAWLPMQWRLPFSTSLTFAAIFVLFGWQIGALMIAVGLGMIGICHLPIHKGIRIGALTAIGLGLASIKAGWITATWANAAVTILGSMFMFRLALYIYDMDNEKKKATLWERLAYFFMLPNTVFPFYPIVDYIQFRRTFYNKPDFEIYQKGILWMLRGTIQLIGYRIVYYYYTPAVEDVEGLGGLLMFIGSAYLLYLRVSGLFHLIVGLMAIFGFNLPETHRRYFLASSFNDYWRRINIYWKDFMMKMFFYPVYMRCRSWGPTNALVFSTFIVFGFTWLLHSYQWFWLQGDFPLTTVDGLYWSILGVAVAINSVWESKRQKKGAIRGKKRSFDVGAAMKLGLRTVTTLVVLSVMWSFWSSESVGQWWTVMQAGGESSIGAYGWLLLGLGGLWAILVVLEWLESKGISIYFEEEQHSFSRNAWSVGLAALALVAIGTPQVQNRIGGEASTIIASLQETRLNARDQAQIERGYYENLLANDNYTSGLMGAQPQQPADWQDIYETDAVELVETVRMWELRPNVDTEFKRAPLTTNVFGMRDQDYEQTKPDSTYRMALLGASYVMGSGVSDAETFENVTEARLNDEERGADIQGRYEILNFAVGGYGLIQQVAVMEDAVLPFNPDAILYVAQPAEIRRTVERFIPAIREDHEIRFDFLTDILEAGAIQPDTPRPTIRKHLFDNGEAMVEWGYGRIAEMGAEIGALPVLVFLPNTRRDFEPGEVDYLTELARGLGFEVINMETVFEGEDITNIQIAPWDFHPNPRGHRLISDQLYDGLVSIPELLHRSTDDVVAN